MTREIAQRSEKASEVDMSKLIYLVDDKPGVRHVLASLLRVIEPNWRIAEFTSAAEALAAVRRSTPNVILADQSMPGMSGAELLDKVREMGAPAIRIIISGYLTHAERIGAAHQYLRKPFKHVDMVNLIRQALHAQEGLRNKDLARLVTSLSSFPVLPGPYHELIKELDKDDATLARLAELLSRDGGSLSRVIQLANSPMFGGAQVVSDPRQALLQLGTSCVKALVLSLHVFQNYQKLNFPEIPLDVLWRHSWQTARLAQELCREELGGNAANEAFFAGLVHDLGCLILIENEPDRYRAACQIARRDRVPLVAAEQQVFQASHLDLSSFMLRLWGMSDAVIDAVTHCEAPWNAPQGNAFGVPAGIYLAHMFVCRQDPRPEFFVPDLDKDYLTRIGMPDPAILAGRNKVQNLQAL